MNIQNDERIQEYISKLHQINEQARQNGIVPLAYVLTFGCQQNEADSEKLRGMLILMGYTITSSAEDADIILVNTCAVREHAELKALSVVGGYKHLKAKKPDLLIGVCGCMTAQEHRAEEIKNRYPYVDFTLEPSAIQHLPQLVYERLCGKRRRFLYGTDVFDVVEGVTPERELSHRAWVSIMHGCNNFCSYCIVPYVRGRERSRSSQDVLEEVRSLVENGCKDITLLGQNVNSYSSDCDFATLIERICKIDGDFLVRFMTSHPKDVPDRLIEVMKNEKKVAPHFHLPIQSGSDRILEKMNRHYDISHYMEIVKKLRQSIPDICLTSDIIVGFPTETEEDFSDTLKMLEDVRFDMVYSFIYSKRKGTPAAEEEQQIDEKTKSERFSRLLELQENISLECNRSYEGKVYRVLVDSESKNAGIYSGRTETNKLVHFAAQKEMIGTYVEVFIERADPFALHGYIIK
jgi:tRNA-2-methylthio-N6-dimethylallyladenosine synthase